VFFGPFGSLLEAVDGGIALAQKIALEHLAAGPERSAGELGSAIELRDSLQPLGDELVYGHSVILHIEPSKCLASNHVEWPNVGSQHTWT
jgi:hypothetical protein